MALFTVIRAAVTTFPAHPLVIGVTCIIPTNCPLVVLVDLKAGIVAPVPDTAKPIPGSEFVQVKLVLGKLAENVIGCVISSAQIDWSPTTAAIGEGLT